MRLFFSDESHDEANHLASIVAFIEKLIEEHKNVLTLLLRSSHSLSAATAHQERRSERGPAHWSQFRYAIQWITVKHSKRILNGVWTWIWGPHARQKLKKAGVGTILQATVTIARESGTRGLYQTRREIAKGSLYLHDTVTPCVY